MSENMLSPLLTAAERGDTALVSLLLQEGENINSRNVFGMNCFHIAANRGHYDLVCFLINYSTVINSVCLERESVCPSGVYDGYTALHFNASNGNLDVAKLLISNGANLNTKEQISGRTPILIAIETCRTELIKMLIKFGADIHARDKHGNTAFHIAAESGCSEIDELFEIILQCGVNMNVRNRRGNTALHIACKRHHSKVIKILLANNCNINVKNRNGKTPLYNAVEEITHTEIVRMLLENGANTSICDINGDTPFHVACRKNNTLHVNLLLEYGCDINAVDNDHFTALHFAARYYYRNIVQILLKSGIDVDYKNKHGETALALALDSGSIDIAKLLMAYGSDVHVVNRNDETLLHRAVSRGNFSVVQLMLKCGADFDAVDDCERTALDLALENRNSSIAKFLLDYGCNVNLMKSEFVFPAKFFMYCKDIAVLFLKHIVRLKALGSYVSEQKLVLLDVDPLKSSFKIKAFQDDCVKEITVLKQSKIANTCITLYDFLKKDISKLVMCLRNKNIVNVAHENYKSNLPIYGNMIRFQFEKGFIRKSMVESSRRYFDMAVASLPLLPNYCIEIIMSNLNNRDLKSLIDVFNPHTVTCPEDY